MVKVLECIQQVNASSIHKTSKNKMLCKKGLKSESNLQCSNLDKIFCNYIKISDEKGRVLHPIKISVRAKRNKLLSRLELQLEI